MSCVWAQLSVVEEAGQRLPLVQHVGGGFGQLTAGGLGRVRRERPALELLEDGQAARLTQRRPLGRRAVLEVRKVLESVDSSDQSDWIGHPAVRILERHELAPRVRETADLERIRHLPVEETVEDAGAIGLDRSGPPGEKLPGTARTFAGFGVAEDDIMLVAEVRPDGAPLDVRRSSRVEHLEAGCIRANDMRVLSTRSSSRLTSGASRSATPPVQSDSVETGMLAPVRA